MIPYQRFTACKTARSYLRALLLIISPPFSPCAMAFRRTKYDAGRSRWLDPCMSGQYNRLILVMIRGQIHLTLQGSNHKHEL